MNTKLKVFSEIYELCGKPERLYKLIFEKMFVKYQAGFTRPDGKLRTKECSFNAYPFLIDNISRVSYTSLTFSEVNHAALSARVKLIINCSWEQNWAI